MECQTKEIMELHGKVDPPSEPIPINVDPFNITDETLEGVELRDLVNGLKKQS